MHLQFQASENVKKCATAKTSSDALCSVIVTRIHRAITACCAIDRSAYSTRTPTLFLTEILTFMR